MKGLASIEIVLIAVIIIVAVFAVYFGWQFLQTLQAQQYWQQHRCDGLNWFGCAWEGLTGWWGQNRVSGSVGLGIGSGLICAGGLIGGLFSFGATAIASLPACGVIGVAVGGLSFFGTGGTVGELISGVIFGSMGIGIPIIAGLVMGGALTIWITTLTGGAIFKVPYAMGLSFLIFLIGFAVGFYIGQTIMDLLPYIALATVVALGLFFYLKYVRKQ